jgi:MFS family permease
MAVALALVWIASVLLLKRDLGKAKNKPKFNKLFSKSRAINVLSAARLFLFGARDIWFVIALPVFLSSQLGWNFWWVGGFLASWVIGYGIVQSFAPKIIGAFSSAKPDTAPGGRAALAWAIALALVTALMALALLTSLPITQVLIIGLILFGVAFAINSSLHSYLIVSYAKDDGVSLDVGFYYMANAMGRLIGTLLSGYLYQTGGMILCLWATTGFLIIVCVISLLLPKNHSLAP